jgi:type I restriction enzyme S subunit
MTRWPTKPLGELATDLQPGFACRPSERGSEIPQIRPLNLTELGTLTLDGTKSVECSKAQTERYSLLPKDVLFNNTNSPELVGKVAVFREAGHFVFSNHITRIRVRGEMLSPEFLHRFLFKTWSEGLFQHHCTQWVNQAAFNADALAKLSVPVPPLAEQRWIVQLLDEADELRKRRAEADCRTSDLVPALFHEMFGDPVRNSKGWKVNRLADVGKLDRGRSRNRPRDEPSLYGGKYPFIQTGDVANANGVISEYSQTYSEKGLAQSRIWPAGTLCITIAANIGKTAILTFPACFPDSIVGFIPGESVIAAYVHQWLITMESRLEQVAPQMAQKNINLKILSELTIPVPPLPLQEDFAKLVTEIRGLEAEQASSGRRLEDLFQSLLHRAFRGEL